MWCGFQILCWVIVCGFQIYLLGYNIVLLYPVHLLGYDLCGVAFRCHCWVVTLCCHIRCFLWLSDAFAGLRHGSSRPAALPSDRWSCCCCHQVTPQPAARQACSGCRCVLFIPSSHLEVMLGSWGSKSLNTHRDLNQQLLEPPKSSTTTLLIEIWVVWICLSLKEYQMQYSMLN